MWSSLVVRPLPSWAYILAATALIATWRHHGATVIVVVLYFTTGALSTRPIFVTTTVVFALRTVLFMPRLLATWAMPFPLIFHLRAALRLARVVFMRGRRHFPAFTFTRQSSRGLFTVRRGIDAGFVLLTPFDGGRGVGLGSFSSRWGR